MQNQPPGSSFISTFDPDLPAVLEGNQWTVVLEGRTRGGIYVQILTSPQDDWKSRGSVCLIMAKQLGYIYKEPPFPPTSNSVTLFIHLQESGSVNKLISLTTACQMK